MSKMISTKNLSARWPESIAFLFFFGLAIAPIILPLAYSSLGSARYLPAWNAALSVGTGGVVSFLFFYLVNDRSDRRRRSLLRTSVQAAYTEAKRAIVQAVIQASRKGGRTDLRADQSTIDVALTV